MTPLPTPRRRTIDAASPLASPGPDAAQPPHFAALLRERAETSPSTRAYAICRRGRWAHFTVGQLEAVSDGLAHQLCDQGLVRGERVLILVPPGFELFATIFAVMKLGAVPVLIDFAAGFGAFRRCLEDTVPTVMISTSSGHLLRHARASVFRSIRLAFTLGRFGGRRLIARAQPARGSFSLRWPPEQAPAAIIFTSGSTGTPKGCQYSHAQFVALVSALRTELEHEPGSADLSTFPILGLFAPILGGTSVLPDMDFSRPSRADPGRLLQSVVVTGCTTMFGSALLVERLCAQALAAGWPEPLTRVMTGGAPPSPRLLRCVQGPGRPSGPRLVIPYGSTECLLVSVGDSRSLPPPGPLGVCVGRPIVAHQVRIITVTDEPIARWRPGLELPPGRIGEITVCGPLVSSGYEGRADLTRLAKIKDGDRVVHRMGDLGALDEQGRLWVAGRQQHRVVTPEGDVFPLVVESVANAEPGVARSALIDVEGSPWLLLELEPRADLAEVCARVRRRLADAPSTRLVREVRETSRPFPVDTRHEVKIDRRALSAEWSQRAARSHRSAS